MSVCTSAVQGELRSIPPPPPALPHPFPPQPVCTVEPFSGVEIHMEMDMEWKWSGNGAQFVKIVWIGLDLGQSVALTPCDRHGTFTKPDKSNTETRFYLID